MKNYKKAQTAIYINPVYHNTFITFIIFIIFYGEFLINVST